MIIALKVVFCFIFAAIATSCAEAVLHRFLFHKKLPLVSYLLAIWHYTQSKHRHHHIVCHSQMEDHQDPLEDYWVQRPSNVAAAGFGTYLLEVLILWAVGFTWPYLLLTGFFTILTFAFWYKFEDHFHVAMHKSEYYQQHIEGTWQDPWFQYAKRLHTIHHKNTHYNYGFVLFPVGDLLMGTYCSDESKLPQPKQD